MAKIFLTALICLLCESLFYCSNSLFMLYVEKMENGRIIINRELFAKGEYICSPFGNNTWSSEFNLLI